MYYRIFPYIGFLLISAGISFVLSCFGSSKAGTSGQLLFSIMMLICAFWSICNAFELMGTTLSVKLFWANMQYIAYGASPVCLTLLVFLLTGFWRKVKIRTIIFLLIIPAVTAALVWFDPKFDLVCYNFSLIRYHGNAFIHKSYGPWFYVHLVYSYSLMLYSAGMLVVKIIREKQIYKNQSFFLWISILLVFVPNILFVRGIRPGGNFDVTPFFFSMAGIIVFLDIFRYRFLDLIPVARGIIFENIHDGIIVADSGYRIIDMNKRAEELFRISGDTLHGYAAGTASVPVC